MRAGFSVSVNCTRSPAAKSAGPCFVSNRTSAPGQLAAVAPHLAQLGVQRVHVAVGVGEHEPRGVGLGRGVALPGRDQGRARVRLVVGPGDRAGLVERRHGLAEPALGQVARRLRAASPTRWRVISVISAAPCRWRSSVNSPPRSMLASWRSSPARITFAPARRASASSSPVTRLSSIAASSTITTVRRSQLRPPVLQPEQLGVHRAGLGEPVRLQVLRHGVGRCQADHPPARPLVRVADRREGIALPGPGAALDDLQPAGGDRMIERATLIRPQACATPRPRRSPPPAAPA